VEESLHGRRSIRTYSDEPLTLLEISQLLWAAYGITKKQDSPEFLRGGFKTAPSAGGLYPLEIYIVVGKVTGIPAGVYKYIPKDHKLIKILDGDKRKALAEAGHSQSMINEAPVSFVYSAVFERTTKKYGDRGRERYVWLDAGHSAQNIYLQAYTLGIGVCVSGAFTDIMVKKAVNMIRQEEPVYIIPAGKIKKQG
jgi:SagB-type dehydrogenase family enzyme